MSGFSRGVLKALTIFLAIWIARYWPVNDFWLVFEGLARPFWRVWWCFVHGSREI